MEVLEELIEKQYEQSDPGFLNLVESSFLQSMTPLLRILSLQVYDFIQSQPSHCIGYGKNRYVCRDADQINQSIWATEVSQLILQQLRAAQEMAGAAKVKSSLPQGSKRYLIP